jgi:hypothetical protein
MAHFARLNENNEVVQVVVVDNCNLLDENGVEQESIGVDYIHQHLGDGDTWVQTSYNNKFRGKYAGLGDIWDGSIFTSPNQ